MSAKKKVPTNDSNKTDGEGSAGRELPPVTRMAWPAPRDLAHYYGKMELGDDGHPTARWLARSLTIVRLPYAMRCAWDPYKVIRKVRVHRQVARSLTQVLSRVLEHFGLDEVRALGLDLYGGCYALPCGDQIAARHYGAAIRFGLGEDLPAEFIALFEAAGWTYDGATHFEAVS